MAFSLKIVVSSTAAEEPSTEISPAWWNHRELLQNYPFDKQLNHGYLDYRLPVSREAFVNIFLEQMPHLEKEIYAHQDWQRINAQTMKQLTTLIQKPDDALKIEIVIFEWES